MKVLSSVRVRCITMERRGRMPAPDGWVQVVREQHRPAEHWPRVGRNESAVHPMPSHAGRGQIAPTGRWHQRKMRSSMSPQVVEEAAKKKVGGIEAALAALAAVGTTGPEVSMLTACLQKARRFSTRTTNRCAVEPAGVCCREGEEAFDCPRGSSPATRPRAGGEQSLSSTPPGCGSSGSTSSASRCGNPGEVSPTDSKPASGRTRCLSTGTPGLCLGAPKARGKHCLLHRLPTDSVIRCPPWRRCSSTIACRFINQTCKMLCVLVTSRKLLELTSMQADDAAKRSLRGGAMMSIRAQESAWSVKSTSPVTENHYKNGYVKLYNNKNFIMTNVDNNRDTKYTINNDTNNHDAHELHE